MEIRECNRCANRLLHPGDQISFGGDKSEFSTLDLQKLAKFKGLRIQGLSKQVRYLISSGGSNSATVMKAKLMGIQIISPKQFEKELEKLCQALVKKSTKKPFNKIVKDGSRIYVIGLNQKETSILEDYLKKQGAKISPIMNATLTAAVCSKFMLKSDKSSQLIGLNVPIYDFSRIKLESIRG